MTASDFWTRVYAVDFGWNWEILANESDPFDPEDDGRYVRDLMPDCADNGQHDDCAWDDIDGVWRCLGCDLPVTRYTADFC
jgi:hypothetical protein